MSEPAPGQNIELPTWVATHVGLREPQHGRELAALRERCEQLAAELAAVKRADNGE